MPYILNTEKEQQKMLKEIGLTSLEDLYAHLPSQIKLKEPLNLERGLSEQEVKDRLKQLSEKNIPLFKFNSFLGAGCYDHYVPSPVFSLINLPQFLTAYTPYQAECSQGILQAIFEYQSFMCLLTGLDVCNASLLDGASSLAESILMSLRISGRKKVIISNSIHPEYKITLKTYLTGFDFEILELGFNKDGIIDLEKLENLIDNNTACIAFSSPNFFGLIEDGETISGIAHKYGALSIMVANPLSFAILKSPKELGVDIVCGDGGVFGGQLNFGGSSFGYLVTRQEFVRQMPGRIVGQTTDMEGKLAYCLTLQTREQHIRREKATSNICSNHSLCAIAAAIYLSLLGKDGLREVALFSLNLAHYLYDKLHSIEGIRFPFRSYFFNEFVWEVDNAQNLIEILYKRKIIAGFYLGNFYPDLKNCILSCCTEKKKKEDIDEFVETLKEIIR
ncbi:MAG: aminomethyl-transferring glycine dehydrogenase subunit GcvPA [Candidatus Omnitrophica bacterium]|nr:aminomethyl-transferring glycine dehydrogenase subunit GcvPA [Candidatus Omnitrophota bacterium]MCM8831690.1 aminomethyl-transferring glycine dehydrogenase subunit GcvPA [Candidatus Omnitrophota bacterium]